jgi:hypothetical protein
VNDLAVTNRPSAAVPLGRIVIVVSYAALGSILCWSRLVGLRAGYCCDEIRTVTEYVSAGPRAILTGPYVPNNHELFNLLGWATSSLVGESEITLRLLSVLPFLIGVGVVTAWLHVRIEPLSAVLFLFLATVSPLMLDISRMARGYGLAFLAMSVLIVAALEMERSGSALALGAFLAAGVAGSWTLPHFSIAFVATGIVLLLRQDVRARLAVGMALSIVAIVAWYGPHFDDFATSVSQEYGVQIETSWLVTAPIDQTLVPALTFLDDTLVRPNLASLLWAVVWVLLIASSPFLRQPRTALILCSGVVTTVVAFWAASAYVAPRFFSFLLVPLFMLVATGAASILARVTTRPQILQTIVAVSALAVVAVLSAPLLVTVPRVPREATSEAAQAIRALVPSSTPVFAHVPYPRDIAFHLGRSVEHSWSPAEAREVCRSERLSVYVEQDFLVPDAAVPCTRRAGTRHYRFEQYARGNGIDVWIIPAHS